MKKTIILLCALLAPLLAACNKVPGSSDTASGNPSETVPYMLKVPPEDRNQAFFSPSFVETPEGYYYGYFVSDDNELAGTYMIYFCSRGGDAFHPLCSKPNCKHDDMNCNAAAGFSFGYYDGALYAADLRRSYEKKIEIVRINMDGTDHRVVAEVDLSELPRANKSCVFHHGKLFVLCYASSSLPLQEQVDHMIVFDLSDFSQTEPVADYLRTAGCPSYGGFYKDKLYGFGDGKGNRGCKEEDLRLIEMDVGTGEIRSPLPGYIDSFYETDSTWYYFVSAEFGTAEWTPGFHEYDVESGAIKDCGLPVEDLQYAEYDEDFIYAEGSVSSVDGSKTLYCLSRDYKLLGRVRLAGDMSLAAITSDRIFVYDDNRDQIGYYIDKSQIGTGELELIPIKTVG